MSQSLFDKLQLNDEKNLLVQGLPSSIEKQFSKLSFAKNVTPLLKSRKIDFALIFAVNEVQLNGILRDVMPSLKEKTKLTEQDEEDSEMDVEMEIGDVLALVDILLEQGILEQSRLDTYKQNKKENTQGK